MKKEKRNEELKLEIGNFINSKPESELLNYQFTSTAIGRIPISGMRVGFGREGPPGRARSPGTGLFLFPDHPPWIKGG